MALTWKAEECIITFQPAACMDPAVGLSACESGSQTAF